MQSQDRSSELTVPAEMVEHLRRAVASEIQTSAINDDTLLKHFAQDGGAVHARDLNEQAHWLLAETEIAEALAAEADTLRSGPAILAHICETMAMQRAREFAEAVNISPLRANEQAEANAVLVSVQWAMKEALRLHDEWERRYVAPEDLREAFTHLFQNEGRRNTVIDHDHGAPQLRIDQGGAFVLIEAKGDGYIVRGYAANAVEPSTTAEADSLPALEQAIEDALQEVV